MQLIDEEWKAISEFEGIYEISNYGRVKRLQRVAVRGPGTVRTLKELIRKTRLNQGYETLFLKNGAVNKNVKIHRLVAQEFIDNPHSKIEVNHKDGNKTNNYVGNLEWCTRKENAVHAFRNGLIKFRKGQECLNAKLSNEKVIDIKKRIGAGVSSVIIGEKFGVSKNTINDIKFNRTWTHI